MYIYETLRMSAECYMKDNTENRVIYAHFKMIHPGWRISRSTDWHVAIRTGFYELSDDTSYFSTNESNLKVASMHT